MLWIGALLILIAGYFVLLTGRLWINWRKETEEKTRLILLTFRNAQDSVEGIMWDLFRLKSWKYQDFSFMIMDDRSYDDTLQILKTLRKNHPFILIDSSLGKRYERIMKLQKKVIVIDVNGPESPRLVRKKIIYLLNRYNHDSGLSLRKYS